MERNQSIQPNEISRSEVDLQHTHSLVLFNDEVNQYDFVIETLIDVCKHNHLQAEQCTLIAHHKGNCDVKLGKYSALEPLRDELLRRGLSATIKSN